MFSSIRTATAGSFVYTPPTHVARVVRVLVIAGTVKPDVLANVLRGFWRFTPITRVLIAEHEALATTMMNENMRPVDLDSLPMRPYESRLPGSKVKVIAPTLLAEVDTCIVLNTLDDAQVSPSLAVIQSLTQNNASPQDAYFCIGDLFAGSVVDTGDKIVWGDNLLDVDATAYRVANHPPAPELAEITGRLGELS
ncbi:MAG TPA: hypothetical protein VHL11_07000 [Phototrophicaceae bacterium]|jgi:hypothetical protein|nr:hypothetical protein [Phototrophicaceae bacterium]